MLDEKGNGKIDRKKVTAEVRFDGKYVVHSNDDTLTAEDMAVGYATGSRCGSSRRGEH